MIGEPNQLLVGASTVAGIMGAPDFDALVAEYAAEAATEGLPPPGAKMATYQHLEAIGMLHAFSAVIDSALVGFIALVAPTLPHYGATIAVSESFFVAKAHRGTLAGLRLLAAAEHKALALGSPVLLVSTPFNGRLFHLLPKLGYVESSRVFCKRLADA